MQSLFDTTSRASILERLATLQPTSPRQWGKMDPAQMLTHCSIALEAATGIRPLKQRFLGKLLAPLVKKSILGEAPFKRNSPTDATFIVSDPRDFTVERERLRGLIDRFCKGGPTAAERYEHAFFGKLKGEEWGTLMCKHLDHHLRQFSV